MAQGRNRALAPKEVGATEGGAPSEQPTQGPVSDTGAAGSSQGSPVERSRAGVGDPVVTSPESPRSIWNPALKPKALLAGVQLPSPSFLDTQLLETESPRLPPTSLQLFISCFVPRAIIYYFLLQSVSETRLW